MEEGGAAMGGRGDVRSDMFTEAIRIIDTARGRGVTLRLIGGLAVRKHCTEIDFCDRDYGDIDMVGLRAQMKGLVQVFQSLGYRENMHVANATGARQLQFYRECTHRDAASHYFIHPDDHVDVFMNTFKMDHDIDLRKRLHIDEYTISVSDLLISKLQIAKINEKDIRDILTIFMDTELGDTDVGNRINVRYIARLCAGDWGLTQDVLQNLERCDQAPGGYGMDGEQERRVRLSLADVRQAVKSVPKSPIWKLRALFGKRLPWHREVEGQDAEPAVRGERMRRHSGN
jgi:hypothetical protein